MVKVTNRGVKTNWFQVLLNKREDTTLGHSPVKLNIYIIFVVRTCIALRK